MSRAPPSSGPAPRDGARPEPLSVRCCTGGPHALRDGHDDVDLADLGYDGLQISHDGAVAALDDRAGIQGLDPVERVIEVLEIAVQELRRARAVRDHDALREVTLVERGRR